MLTNLRLLSDYPDIDWKKAKRMRDIIHTTIFFVYEEDYVDREETEIMKANTVMRAVIIPRGEHLVRFVYDPVPFNNGLKLGLCTLIGIPIMIFVSNLPKWKKH